MEGEGKEEGKEEEKGEGGIIHTTVILLFCKTIKTGII